MLGAGTAEKEADFNPIGALHAEMAGVVIFSIHVGCWH